MTTPFNTVGASPLGAFIESALGARAAVASEAELPLTLLLVDSDRGAYLFDGLDLSTLHGPLLLNSAETNNPVAADRNEDATLYVVNWDKGSIEAFDTEGEQAWIVSAGAGERYEEGLCVHGDVVFAQLRHTTTNTNDTITIQALSLANGSIVDSVDAELDEATPFETFGFGLVVIGETLFSLTAFQTGTDEHTVIIRSFAVDTLTAGTTRTMQTANDLGVFDDFTFLLGRGDATLYAGFLEAGTFTFLRWDALDPGDLTDINAKDLGSGISAALTHIPLAMDEDASESAANGPFFFMPSGSSGSVRARKRALTGSFERFTEIVQGDTYGVHHLSPLDLSALLSLSVDADSHISDDPYSETVTASGGTPDFWALQIAPSGATINASGVVSWASPVKAGSPHTFRAYAANSTQWGMTTWQVSVQDTAPVIDAIADDTAEPDTEYTEQATLSSGDTPVTWSIVQGPSGTTVSSSGLVTMPGQEDGVYTLEVKAENAAGFDTEVWDVTVETVAPVISPTADDDHDSSTGAYQKFVALSDGTTPVVWSFDSGNPSGMTINNHPDFPTLGLIDWATPVPGVYNIVYRATNSAGFDTDEYVLTVT